MANITYLSSEDFIVMGTRQKTLGITSGGNVLVFFKMRCANCAEFEPIFAKLANKENRVTHAILDLTQNKDVAISSRETNTPIMAVPVLILYVNGRPHALFKGKKNITSIQAFITKALQATAAAPARNQQQFMPSAKTGGKVNKAGGYQTSAAGGKAWLPDIGRAPSMKGIIKGAGSRSGGGGGGYSHGANVDDDDEPRLLIPDNIVPHNAPWEADFVNQDM